MRKQEQENNAKSFLFSASNVDSCCQFNRDLLAQFGCNERQFKV
jgi:hypothetical protein